MFNKLGLILIICLFLGACGQDQSREDAKDVTHVVKTPPEVVPFNNHYPNIETQCDGHGHRIYVGTHDSSTGNNILVIDDANCPGGVQK